MKTERDYKDLDNLMKDVKEFLRNGLEGEVQEPKSLIKYYWKASLWADRLITMVFGAIGRLPVNVERLAEVFGIEIRLENLNEFSLGRSMNRKLGQIEISENFFTNEEIKKIYIDKKAPLFSQRYAIAHELAHYIMHYDNKDYYEDYCIMPMCPNNVEEIIVDIFATFLLVPVRYFFEEFSYYVNRMIYEMETPITTEKWIQYLAERSMLSEYYVAYGYQQLRYVAYWIYQAWNCDDEKIVMTGAEIDEVRRETKDYYTERIGDLLFQ